MEVSINSNDSITWDGFQSNQVSISAIWNSLRHKGGQPPWYNTVWNEFSINKCSFTLWTALKNRLLTRDRMLNFHMQTPSGCLFCNNLESVEHLFSTCPFFDLVRRACPVTISDDWSQWQEGAFFSHNIDKRKSLIGSLYLAVAVHLVWKERNHRLHNPGPGHATIHIINQLRRTVSEKLFSCAKFQKWARGDKLLICLLY